MYYKVVKNVGSLVSVVHSNSVLTVEYKIGECAFPSIPGSSLMVFDNLDAAIDFSDGWWGEVYECEITDPSVNGVFVYQNNCESSYVYEHILNILGKRRLSEWADAPNGTVFCSSVKLIRKV